MYVFNSDYYYNIMTYNMDIMYMYTYIIIIDIVNLKISYYC